MFVFSKPIGWRHTSASLTDTVSSQAPLHTGHFISIAELTCGTSLGGSSPWPLLLLSYTPYCQENCKFLSRGHCTRQTKVRQYTAPWSGVLLFSQTTCKMSFKCTSIKSFPLHQYEHLCPIWLSLLWPRFMGSGVAEHLQRCTSTADVWECNLSLLPQNFFFCFHAARHQQCA